MPAAKEERPPNVDEDKNKDTCPVPKKRKYVNARDRGTLVSKLTWSRISYGETFTILVGPDAILHNVHKHVLVRNSAFFRIACNSKFREAQDKIIRLPEMKNEDFEVYMQWAYTNEVVVKDDDDCLDDPGDESQWHSLVRLYGATHILVDIPLRNAIIDTLLQLRKKYDRGPNIYVTQTIYQVTPPECKLRAMAVTAWLTAKLFVDCIAGKELANKLPHEFLVDFMAAKIDDPQFSSPGVNWDNRCNWHEHNEELPESECEAACE